MGARGPVLFWWENESLFTASFCENGVVMRTSARNVGDLVFLELRKDLAIIIQNNCVKFVARNTGLSCKSG